MPMIPMEQAEETWTVEVRLMIDSATTDRDTLQRVHQALSRYPGPCKGYLHICMDDAQAVVSMNDGLRIRYCDAMTREVNAIFGYDAVQTRCIDAAAAMRNGDLNGGRRGHNGRHYSANG
jgi:DNA polymerase-3 subunit alpha